MASDVHPEIKERLSSWRRTAGVGKHHALPGEETGVNETEVRLRQRRIGNMCLSTLKQHAAFYAQLEDFVRHDQEERTQYLQQRIEDMAAFALGVFEQSSAENLHNGLRNELAGLPKEIIETITIPAPQPPKSWFQRILGG